MILNHRCLPFHHSPRGTNKLIQEEHLKTIVKDSKSLAEVIKKLGLVVAGGNYNSVRRKIAQFNLDTRHFTGQLWSKGRQLKDYSEYSQVPKKHLLNQRGDRCEICGIEDWLTVKLTKEIDHIDGNSLNNNPDNLRILCPNCHSQTPTWRGRKNSSATRTQKYTLRDL